MTDPYGRDEEHGTPIEFDPERLGIEDIDLSVDMDGPMDLHESLMEDHEEALVKSLFRQIRETTPDEEEREALNPTMEFVEDPEDVEPAMPDPAEFDAREKYPAGGCHRLDAEGQPLSIDLLYDAMEEVHREGYDPRSGWEFWLHHNQLQDLRHREANEWWDTPDLSDEYGAQVADVPMRAFPLFPMGAVLLLDPSALVPQHGVGSRTAQGVMLKDPRRVLRVTSIGKP